MKSFPPIIAHLAVKLTRILHIADRVTMCGLLILINVLAFPALAHELQDNRAVLILREPNHIVLTLYLDYLAAIAQELSAKSGPDQFVMMSATLSPDYFQRLSSQAQTKFETGIMLKPAKGAPILFQNWHWPDPQKLQQEARTQIMQAITQGQDHPHSPLIEVSAEIFSANPLQQVSIQFPASFGKVLLVSYHPHQKWLDPGMAGPVDF